MCKYNLIQAPGHRLSSIRQRPNLRAIDHHGRPKGQRLSTFRTPISLQKSVSPSLADHPPFGKF